MEPRELFEIVVRELSESVRAFLLASVRDLAVAEDLLQETFLTAWKNLDRYDRELPFGPWARGIAARLLLNHRRKLGRAKVYFCDASALQGLEQRFSEFAGLRGETFDEKLDALRGCMECLTDLQRTALELHYEHGQSCKTIAVRTGLSCEAIKKHLQRGRMALYRCLRHKASFKREESA